MDQSVGGQYCAVTAFNGFRRSMFGFELEPNIETIPRDAVTSSQLTASLDPGDSTVQSASDDLHNVVGCLQYMLDIHCGTFHCSIGMKCKVESNWVNVLRWRTVIPRAQVESNQHKPRKCHLYISCTLLMPSLDRHTRQSQRIYFELTHVLNS